MMVYGLIFPVLHYIEEILEDFHPVFGVLNLGMELDAV